MKTERIDAIAKAVLYEGYMLYPYRPSSVKNRQRFNFGVLYPKSYSEAQTGADAWSMETEVILQGSFVAKIEVRVRFLKLVSRSVGKLREPTRANDESLIDSPKYETVPALEVEGKIFTPWQEAIECEVSVPVCNVESLTTTPVDRKFTFPAKEETEPLHDSSGGMAGQIVRRQESVCGTIEISAAQASEGIFKLQVRVKNLTPLEEDANQVRRDLVLMRSLVSAHAVLGAVDGEFVSLLEPPGNLRELAASCQNLGVWPVLVGAEGERDTMLASPIILYDYPQIAPESPGDLFDGTEIDEILALRILTMTDDEKTEMRNTDERARKVLERTETLPMEHLMKLHGTLRELRPFKEEMP
jgi:hypothetical protein